LNVVSQPGASESLDTLDHATVLRAATFAEALGYGWVHRDAH